MSARGQDPEPPPAQRFDEEYRAIEASLREYLDRRLTLLSPDDEMHDAKPEGWFRKWRIDLYFAVTIVLLAFIWWRLSAPAPQRPPAAEPAAAVEAPSPEPAAGGGGPPAESPAAGEPRAEEAADVPAPEPGGEAAAEDAEPEPAAEDAEPEPAAEDAEPEPAAEPPP